MKISRSTKKILANGGYSFFLTFSTSVSLGSLVELNIPIWYYLGLACFVSVINFGLVVCREIVKKEEEQCKEQTKKCDYTQILGRNPECNVALPDWRLKVFHILDALVLVD